MVAYNFKSQFAEAVESGQKRQTIRANGKRKHAHPGDALQLYTGQRTKACRKLVDTTCVSSEPITIDSKDDGYGLSIMIGEKGPLDDHQIDSLAKADGFENEAAMHLFFGATHGLPFKGTLIRW